ncbi:MAG: GumC family protein [Candidatus Glassbacteria bacterium]
MNEFYRLEKPEEEKYNFRKYFKIVGKRKWILWVTFLLIFCPVLIMTLVQSFSPVYEASASIWVENSSAGLPAFDLTSSQNEGLIQILKSRTFAETIVNRLGLTLRLDTREPSILFKVLSKLNLIENPDTLNITRQNFFKNISISEDTEAGLYQIASIGDRNFYLYKFDENEEESLLVSKAISNIIDQPFEMNGFSVMIDTSWSSVPFKVKFTILRFKDAVMNLMDNTQVIMGESGNFIILTVSDGDPVLAKDITNTLSQMFVDYNLSFKKEQTRNTMKILQEQLDVASRELAESEKAVKHYKETTGIVSLNAEVRDRIEKLAEVEAERMNLIEELKTLDSYLDEIGDEVEEGKIRSKLDIYLEAASYPWTIPSANLSLLRDELIELREERNTLALKVTESHPDLIDIDTNIMHMQDEILLALQKHREVMEEKSSALSKELRIYQSHLTNLPSEELELARLERDTKVNENVYTQVFTKFKEAQIMEAAEIADIRILDPAILPEKPVNKNNRKKLLVLGVISGLIMGVFASLLIEYMDTTIKSAEDVKESLGLPVLGVSPMIDFDESYEFFDYKKAKEIDSMLVTHDYSPTPVGEAYRALRTNIMFSGRSEKNHSMVISSPGPGDGKSFTIANLSITLAQQGARVLLVDGDLRRGVLHNTFACPKTPGLTEILTNRANFIEIINETHIPNLFLISCGSLIPNPSELLGSLRMRSFLEMAQDKFDIIFFDSPPLNRVTDAAVLGCQVDSVILVVRSEETDLKEAKRSIENLENVSARIMGVILNGVRDDVKKDKYSYYHY